MTTSNLDSSEAVAETDLADIVRLLWGYKLVICAIAVVFGVAAVFYAFSMTPVFRAEAVLTEVSDRSLGGTNSIVNQLGGLASLAGVNLGKNGGGESKAVLQSRRLVEEFVVRYQLAPMLLPDAKKPATTWRAVQKFKDSVLSIRESTLKGTMTVSIEWKDATTAAKWANSFVALANELIRTRAIQESQRNIKYLNEQIAQTTVVELQGVMYSLIESETKTLMLASGRDEYAFTLVDPAVAPEIRAKPQRSLIMLVGVAIGGIFGSVLVFIYHLLRRSRPVVARVG